MSVCLLSLTLHITTNGALPSICWNGKSSFSSRGHQFDIAGRICITEVDTKKSTKTICLWNDFKAEEEYNLAIWIGMKNFFFPPNIELQKDNQGRMITTPHDSMDLD
jgi:hypothetical protein